MPSQPSSENELENWKRYAMQLVQYNNKLHSKVKKYELRHEELVFDLEQQQAENESLRDDIDSLHKLLQKERTKFQNTLLQIAGEECKQTQQEESKIQELEHKCNQLVQENQHLRSRIFQLYNPDTLSLSGDFPLPEEISRQLETARQQLRRKVRDHNKVRQTSQRLLGKLADRLKKIEFEFNEFLSSNLHTSTHDNVACRNSLKELLQARWKEVLDDMTEPNEDASVTKMRKLLWQACITPNVRIFMPGEKEQLDQVQHECIDTDQHEVVTGMTPGLESSSCVLLKAEVFHRQ